MHQHDPRVDELRQRLRSLGYLDAGVDRFVLAPARAARAPVLIALLASLRIGLLAGLLLGPAAAVGISGRVPGLVTGARDAVVIALYMGALFGLAVATAALLASLAVRLTARRAPSAVTRHGRGWGAAAGTLVALGCLAYLTLWWQTANAGIGWDAPAWTTFALLVAVAISLLLGHAVRVTTVAVLVAGAEPGTAAPAVPGASWGISLAAGVLAFAGAAAFLVLTAPAESTPAARPALTVVPSGLRTRVVAIDGVDARLLDDLISTGRLPALAAVMDGARAKLASGTTPDEGATQADPARTWTTAATGQPADLHGVYGLETRRIAGLRGSVTVSERSPLAAPLRAATDLLRLTRPSIASGHERREMTFWEVAAEAGLRTAVVNWWATWPASREAGIVLTDRATLRLEHGGDLDSEIAPPELYERLREHWPALRQRAAVLAAAAIDERQGTDIRTVLQRSAELDAMQLLLADAVADRALDLTAVYLPGLDIAQHSLLRSVDDSALSASTAALRVEAVKSYYVTLDRLLAPVVSAARDDEILLVLTAQGRVAAENGEGRLAMTGPVARRGALDSGALVDAAPTILHALGVPISEALAGRPLTTLFTEAFMARYPVRRVRHYAAPLMPGGGRGRPLDQEMIDRLRSLGYVR
ncbi:MAG TPA: alkaline phosphatase family protein [Vicinamibacterales bacterium]|nr:alkaline phosphatase family protein [Vicinamibacterales bacterium]